MTSTVGSGSPGYIEGLELTDFKSYKGVHYIGPFRDFICIIGPNGSGKSNIMDAVSFVLGVKTASMRAANLKDMVYSVAEDVGPRPKKGTVKMFFKAGGKNQVVFQRSVLASTGASEFKVNGDVVTWEKYERTLKGFNILSATRNCLIFQGEVEMMSQKSPKELTELIEIAAGTAELKKEYEIRRKDLKEAQELVKAAGAKKRGAGVEQRIIRGHKEEAKKFHEHMNLLASEKTSHAMLQFYYIETSLVRAKQHQNKVVRAQEERDEERSEKEGEMKSLKNDIAKLHAEVVACMKQEREKQHSVFNSEKEAARKEAHLKTLDSRIAALEDKIKIAEAERSKAGMAVVELEKGIKEQEQILGKHEKDWKKEDEQVPLSKEDYEEFKRLRDQVQTHTLGQTADLKQRKRELDHIARKVESHEAVETDRARRVGGVEERIKAFESKLGEIEAVKSDVAAQEKEWANDLTKVQSEIHAKEELLKQKTDELNKASMDLAGMRNQREESNTSRRMDEALRDMKDLFGGVYGKLYELVKIPNKKHAVAVTAALGKHMESVVTDTERTAHECVKYLREQRIGTMNFIPLNSVRGKEVTDALRVLGGTAKPVADCIAYEPHLSKAIQYALGETIMVDELKEGQRVAWDQSKRHKVVTLDGSVLQKNGVMTGGAASMDARAKKFSEVDFTRHFTSLKTRRDELMQEVKALRLEIIRAQEKEKDLAMQDDSQKQRISIAETNKTMWRKKAEDAAKELAALKAEGAAAEKQHKKLVADRDSLAAKVQEVQGKITEIESEVFKKGQFSKGVQLRDIRDYETRVLNREKDRAVIRGNIKSVVNRLQAQLDFEKKREHPVSVEELMKKRGELVDEKVAVGKKKKKSDADEEKRELKDVKDRLDKKNKALKKLEEKQKEVKRELDGKTAKSDEARKQKQQLLTIQEKLRAQRAALYIHCVAEDINLPVINRSEAKTKKPAKVADDEDGNETQTDAEGLITVSEAFQTSASVATGGRDSAGSKKKTTSDVGKQAAQHLVGIDFTTLHEDLRSAVRRGRDSYKQQLVLLDHNIEKKQDELEKLAPNLKAEGKYTDVKHKVTETTESWREANKALDKANDAFLQIREKRTNKFDAALKTIQDALTEIYGTLTEGTRAAQAAGTAFIQSEEMDEPYLGGTRFAVQPPGKRYRDMEQLSGGEKTIAALALIFAVHKVCPSPFFVLDEVDAALDSTNVDKVIRYVLATTSSCQYLVISLKEDFFKMASSLVGVHKVPKDHTSAVKTLDLTQFDR